MQWSICPILARALTIGELQSVYLKFSRPPKFAHCDSPTKIKINKKAGGILQAEASCRDKRFCSSKLTGCVLATGAKGSGKGSECLLKRDTTSLHRRTTMKYIYSLLNGVLNLGKHFYMLQV